MGVTTEREEDAAHVSMGKDGDGDGDEVAVLSCHLLGPTAKH